MNHTKFRDLINGGEKHNVDFKIECQAFLTRKMAPNAELAKDICAMANNPPNTVNYIIIGVSDDGKCYKSVSNGKLTDENLQSFCKQSIYPPPKIKVLKKHWKKVSTNYRDKELIIIQIGPHPKQAYHLAKDFVDYSEKICYRRHEVWIRRGTTSDLATPDEIVRLRKGKFYGEKTSLENKIEYSKARTITGPTDKTKQFHRLVAAGIQYERIKRYDLVIDCFEDALKIKPNDIGIMLALSGIYGDILGDAGSKNRAIKLCNKILRIDKNNVSAKFNLAVYTSHIKGPQDSFSIYSEAEALIKRQGLANTQTHGKLNIFIGHDIRKIKSKIEAKKRYENAISILKPLAEAGDKVSEFWLRDAEKNLKEVTEEIEKDKK